MDTSYHCSVCGRSLRAVTVYGDIPLSAPTGAMLSDYGRLEIEPCYCTPGSHPVKDRVDTSFVSWTSVGEQKQEEKEEPVIENDFFEQQYKYQRRKQRRR